MRDAAGQNESGSQRAAVVLNMPTGALMQYKDLGPLFLPPPMGEG